MGEFIIKMPDVGEGVAEAEIVEWHVKTGDPVREDMVIAAVMTDKATVEIPSPVNGIVIWLAGEVGDRIAVKAPLVRIETAGDVGEAQPMQISQTPIAETPRAEMARPAPAAPAPAAAPVPTAA
ncbi:2-oxo acid dehydrogenase subunit E2, partial [Rhizobium sp. PRIMUS64]